MVLYGIKLLIIANAIAGSIQSSINYVDDGVMVACSWITNWAFYSLTVLKLR